MTTYQRGNYITLYRRLGVPVERPEFNMKLTIDGVPYVMFTQIIPLNGNLIKKDANGNPFWGVQMFVDMRNNYPPNNNPDKSLLESGVLFMTAERKKQEKPDWFDYTLKFQLKEGLRINGIFERNIVFLYESTDKKTELKRIDSNGNYYWSGKVIEDKARQNTDKKEGDRQQGKSLQEMEDELLRGGAKAGGSDQQDKEQSVKHSKAGSEIDLL